MFELLLKLRARLLDIDLRRDRHLPCAHHIIKRVPGKRGIVAAIGAAVDRIRKLKLQNLIFSRKSRHQIGI